MRRIVHRKLPDGSFRNVGPYHVSMEGLEKVILCRDDEDFDAMVKILCICARRKNVIIVVYAVVSNHCHLAVLAASQAEADGFGQEVKRMYSMWFSRRYGDQKTLRRIDVKAIFLDSEWYIRNALAYILRNALDNGCNVNEYRWSAYRAMFGGDGTEPLARRRVSSLTKNERRMLMHTGDPLGDVDWRLDGDGRLIPSSFCDSEYLEQAFENDQAFFLKTIGSQNPAEMHLKLVEKPRTMLVDAEFYKDVNEISQRWFQTDLANLSLEKKTRMVPYLRRTTKTTIPQLARTLGISRTQITAILGKR
jgi:REP element-mobilizing transposase RayT